MVGELAFEASTNYAGEDEYESDNPRVFMGANKPPAPSPFEGFEAHINDLFTEAKGFLDGEGVQDQGQADAVSKLLDMLRQANKDADAARSAEKKPHDDAGKAVQAKWKPLLDRAELAITTCKDALAPYLRKQEEARRAAAEAARAEAAAKAAEAAAAIQQAHAGTDLAAREAAEAKLTQAHEAQTAANRADKDRAQAKGGARATTLRTHYHPVLTDARAALVHYVETNPDAIKECLLQLAKADVAAGKRVVPGFVIEAEQRVV